MTFGDKLNWMAAEMKLSNTELAKACNLDGGFICKLRYADKIPLKDGPTVKKISDGLCKLILQKRMQRFYMYFLHDGNTLEEKVYRHFNEALETRQEKKERIENEKKSRKRRNRRSRRNTLI